MLTLMGYHNVPTRLTTEQVTRLLREHGFSWQQAREEGFDKEMKPDAAGTYSARKLAAWLGY